MYFMMCVLLLRRMQLYFFFALLSFSRLFVFELRIREINLNFIKCTHFILIKN